MLLVYRRWCQFVKDIFFLHLNSHFIKSTTFFKECRKLNNLFPCKILETRLADDHLICISKGQRLYKYIDLYF